MRTNRRFPFILALAALLAAGPLHAAGSKEKSPAEKASEAARNAVSVYNEGVARMERADAIGTKANIAHSYDYSATPDGKAIREYEQAVTSFAKAIALDPKMKEAHNNLGYCYRKLGKLRESLASYDQAIALDPDFAQAREYRGETYLALGQVDKAEGELAELNRLKSRYAGQLEKSIGLYKERQAQAAAHPGGK